MFKLFIASAFLLTSIYSVQFSDIDGNMQTFNSFQNKKILIVNIATESAHIGQLAQLQQLYLQHQDSLIVIAFPSNSFGKEPKTNAEIKQLCQNTYGVSFHLGAKGSVKGTGLLPIYSWLANQSENGIMDGIVQGDFQKFLIDKNGQIIGVFAPDINPMDSTITNTITDNW